MKVKELIDKLKGFDQETEVLCLTFYSELQETGFDFDLVEKRILCSIDDIAYNEEVVIIECVEDE